MTLLLMLTPFLIGLAISILTLDPIYFLTGTFLSLISFLIAAASNSAT